MGDPILIYESESVLVIGKPAGLLVHSGPAMRDEATLVSWVLARYPEVANVGDNPALRPGIVHRLDRDTSGVMLIARTQTEFERLKGLFQAHSIQKTYYALLRGVLSPREGVINLPIGLVDGSTKRTTHKGKMMKEAVTEYITEKTYEDDLRAPYSLTKLFPKTGRTHQLRVHCATKGCPIVGDKLYGKGRAKGSFMSEGRLMLHAFAIEFPDARGVRVRFESELPRDFLGVLEELSPREGDSV